jgi:hypothetical protein
MDLQAVWKGTWRRVGNGLRKSTVDARRRQVGTHCAIACDGVVQSPLSPVPVWQTNAASQVPIRSFPHGAGVEGSVL